MRTKGCVSSPTANLVQHQQEQLPPQLPTKLLTSTTTEKPLHPRAQIRPNSQNDKNDTEAAEKTSLANHNCRTIASDTRPNSTSATARPITKSTSYKLLPWISADDPDCEDPDVEALRKKDYDRKPSHPKPVLFVGNLPSEIDKDSLAQFIQKRAASAGVTPSIKMHNCNIVTKQQEDGSTSATARITVSQSYNDVLCDKMFWPRPVYARKWIFRQPATNIATSLDLLDGVEASAEVR